MAKKILVTGASGYIGSHTCVELLNSGYDVVAIDNLSNSSELSLDRVEQITGKKLKFIEADVLTKIQLRNIDAVIHFAGLKSVSESVRNPELYYLNNVAGTANLICRMKDAGVNKILFSSSATVYGIPQVLPITEDASLSTENPYGKSKLMAEEIIREVCEADDNFKAGILRYFNPVGAHSSGLIGEDPRGVPANLVPYVCQVALGKFPVVKVFGTDYHTPDGTGIRDYIHVVDLAKAHVSALNFMFKSDENFTVNLGTGRAHSVLEIIKAFEEVTGKSIQTSFVSRRKGDVAACYADPSLAETLLGWKAEKTLSDMVNDHWRWQSLNPNGYSRLE